MLYLVLAFALQQSPTDTETTAAPAAAAAATAGSAGTETAVGGAAPTESETTSTEPSKASVTEGTNTAEDDAGENDADGNDAGEDEDPRSGFWNDVDAAFSSGAIGLLRDGGFFMWPLLLMAVIAAGVIMERYRSLKMLTTDTAAIRHEVARLLREDQIEDAIGLCDREQGPVPAILAAGLRKFLILRRLDYDAGKIDEQVVKGMDDYSIHIIAALERHLPILATISSAAPMIGFLGTVQGMIVAFRNIVEQMGETNIVEAAAAGIQVSLLTTCFGLIVGIPAFVAFNYFTSVINRVVLEVEESATELVENVTLQLSLEGTE